MDMDGDCKPGPFVGMHIHRDIDQKYASGTPLKLRPPVELDLFPLASALPADSGSPDLRRSSGTLPWQKSSPMIDGGDGGDRSAAEGKAGIHPVPVSRGFSVNKLPASCQSCHYGEAAGAIDLSPSSNNTLYSNAINEESGYGMNLKRKWVAADELKNNRVCSRTLSDVEEEGGAKINKIRLSKEQCALLEESFIKNQSPELKDRHALAMQMNLHPRQVDVWFQNRRARTKLKQTEMDCEVLKKCNESLEEENRRLQKELQEFRVLKLASHFTVCPSCEKVAAAVNTAAFTLEKVKSIFTRDVSRK